MLSPYKSFGTTFGTAIPVAAMMWLFKAMLVILLISQVAISRGGTRTLKKKRNGTERTSNSRTNGNEIPQLVLEKYKLLIIRNHLENRNKSKQNSENINQYSNPTFGKKELTKKFISSFSLNKYPNRLNQKQLKIYHVPYVKSYT